MTTEAQATHTPGPWQLADGGVRFWYIYSGRDEIATVRREDPNAKENARLIAAAPALLEALEALLRNRYDHDALAAYQPEWDQASQAIRQAKTGTH